jgi:hypothetical protein
MECEIEFSSVRRKDKKKLGSPLRTKEKDGIAAALIFIR